MRTEAAKSGLTICPFADFLENGTREPPPQLSPSASAPKASTSIAVKELGSLTMGETKVTGKLAPEPINRIVRANFPKFRACYEEGLERDDSMKGTIVVKLTITSSGALENVAVAEGTLKDAAVRKCVTGVYQSLTFPLPDTGKALVTSTIDYRRSS